MSETKKLTFEAGYERLQTIAARLNENEVPVSEMCDLFAEGKGLERALTTYLDEQRERVESIERGEGIRAFQITGATVGKTASVAAEGSSSTDFLDENQFGRVPSSKL
jgi:exodeoxyribonuclease VII small subunit